MCEWDDGKVGRLYMSGYDDGKVGGLCVGTTTARSKTCDDGDVGGLGMYVDGDR